jgi:hypothetical protein
MKLAIALVLAAVGCGAPPPQFGDVDAGTCMAYEVPATEDLSTPSTSFATDVMPLLAMHCSQCHGTTSSPSGNLFLGKSSSDATAVFTGLVGVASGELGDMNFVTTTDPSHSYIMLKLDGDQCLYNSTCAGGTCQDPMPQSGGQLSTSDRDTIRRWIYQGATNN